MKKESHLDPGPNFSILDTYSRPETLLSAVKDIIMIKAVFLFFEKNLMRYSYKKHIYYEAGWKKSYDI